MPEREVQRRLAAIVSADVAGYSRLMGEDEAGTLATMKAHRRELWTPITEKYGGRVVGTAGDSILIEFASAVAAVESSVAVQRGMAEGNADLPEPRRMLVRIGINIGEVIVDGNDIFGDGVNVAARLQELAEPGGVMISANVHEQVEGKHDERFEDAGAHQVKNIVRPINVWRWAPGAAESVSPAIGSSQVLPLPDKPSIAVLPFENMSGDPEQEYFADGISEDIITALSKISQLFVIARNSSFTFKGKSVRVQEVSNDLGVRYVLEGSVRKAGNRVRITSQLIDGVTGGHLWAERFDRDLTDIFAVQDEVTQEIVSALALNLTEGEQQRLTGEHTDNLEAYDYFLRGREQWWRLTAETNAQARTLLERAVELDPNFALAYAFLAAAHLVDHINQWSESAEHSLRLHSEMARRAVALDDGEPFAHCQLGFAYLWARQHELAIAEGEKAIVLDPNFAQGHFDLGWFFHYAGRQAETIDACETGIRLDPHYSDVCLHILALSYFQLGRYDDAVGTLKRRLIRNPDTDTSRVLLASCYGHVGRTEEARAEWEQVFRINPDYSLEHRRKVLPYKNPADFEHVVDGLRKAGLVE